MATRPGGLRDLSGEQLDDEYGADRFTLSMLASRSHYVVEHMCSRLVSTAFSPIIRDQHDFSATLSAGPELDFATPVVARTLPLFYGSMRDVVATTCTEYGLDDIGPGDVLVANDPYRNGTHVNDTVFSLPVFVDDRMVAVLTIRAHLLDLGARVPGGFSGTTRTVYENGLVLPPMALRRGGRTVRSTVALILANSRFGELLLPDLSGIVDALELGERLLRETLDRYGVPAFIGALRYMGDAAAERMRTAVAAFPDGTYAGEDHLDCDGVDPDTAYRVAATVRVAGERVEVDFSGTSVQGATTLNSSWPDLRTSVGMALKYLLERRSTFASAALRDVDIVAPPGSVVTAESPAAVMLYWEPMYCAVAAITKALNGVLGERGLAGDSRASYIHAPAGRGPDGAEWVAAINPVGGWGANAAGDADSGQLSTLVNYLGVEVESVESVVPLVQLRKEYQIDSAGAGAHRGGAGVVADTYWVDDADHQIVMPSVGRPTGFGVHDGEHGGMAGVWAWPDSVPGSDLLDALEQPEAIARARPVSGVFDDDSNGLSPHGRFHHWADGDPWRFGPSAVVRVLTAGGGGWGSPFDRDPAAVLGDVRDGYVSPEAAAERYGVVVLGDPEHDPAALTVDESATRARRTADRAGAEEYGPPGSVAPTLWVEREPVPGECPTCGGDLARYPVLAEVGWYRAVKCQVCLHTVDHEPCGPSGRPVAGPVGELS